MTKLIFFTGILLFIILTIFFGVAITSAAPIVDGVTLQKISTEYYGTAYYVNKQPIAAGTELIAMNQYDDIMGRYIIREAGAFGCTQSYCKNFEVMYYVNTSDKASRTAQMYISFFVNGERARGTEMFKENEVRKIDLVFPSMPPVVTDVPTIPPTLTAVPTVSVYTPTPTEVPTPTPTPANQIPQDVLYGIITAVIVIVGLIVTGVIFTVLYNKTSTDEVIR